MLGLSVCPLLFQGMLDSRLEGTTQAEMQETVPVQQEHLGHGTFARVYSTIGRYARSSRDNKCFGGVQQAEQCALKCISCNCDHAIPFDFPVQPAERTTAKN
ncbi:hypothetical protein RvY_04666-1 [Ramazzottius varieornatus]|uniref:Uncharacterized protein n=1 Tax=Ramazzottius varieornatus TaxID=947166 RepID=A0A1D1USF1_RAMVA|nr:hypothetical protein RvY_04666-1 [Ramazzottius varieornatus]